MDSGISCRGGKNSGYKEPHCLYPGDLYPFTRRPLFIIIDSDNSFVFQHVPRFEIFELIQNNIFIFFFLISDILVNRWLY